MALRRACACLLGLTLTAGAGHAAADPRVPSDVQRSITLFDQGRRLLENGNCKDAIPKLEESLRYNESVGARFSLASCRVDPLVAWREYKAAEALALRKNDERAKGARSAAAALEPKLALVRAAAERDGDGGGPRRREERR